MMITYCQDDVLKKLCFGQKHQIVEGSRDAANAEQTNDEQGKMKEIIDHPHHYDHNSINISIGKPQDHRINISNRISNDASALSLIEI